MGPTLITAEEIDLKDAVWIHQQAQLYPRFDAKAWLPFKMARGTVN
jgi:hypothetical protein